MVLKLHISIGLCALLRLYDGPPRRVTCGVDYACVYTRIFASFNLSGVVTTRASPVRIFKCLQSIPIIAALELHFPGETTRLVFAQNSGLFLVTIKTKYVRGHTLVLNTQNNLGECPKLNQAKTYVDIVCRQSRAHTCIRRDSMRYMCRGSKENRKYPRGDRASILHHTRTHISSS